MRARLQGFASLTALTRAVSGASPLPSIEPLSLEMNVQVLKVVAAMSISRKSLDVFVKYSYARV
jgi:hypothetical protein